MEPLLTRVARGERLIGDGALGTMLIAAGLPSGEAPERWTLERPDTLRGLARDYLEAGADLLTTNTFGASPLRLRAHGLETLAASLNTRAAEIAREAAAGRAYVSGSVGPTGLLLAPLGDADPLEVADGFYRQIAALAAGGADVICIETMSDLEEASLAVRAARSAVPHLPIVVTLTFNVTPRGAFTVMGVTVEAACARLQTEGTHLLGANCGTGADDMRIVAEAFAGCSPLPLVFQPNAGLPQRQEGRLVYPQSPVAFAAETAPLARYAAIVGGCCGTTPAHIAALRQHIEAKNWLNPEP
jgi:5-methyltetrahydrofolate--homocysteine methyltransferase